MNKIRKDKEIRRKIKNAWPERIINKILCNNKILTLKTREQWIFKTKFKFSTQARNYCKMTGRARGVLPTWKVSRIEFKRNADLGLIPGIRKGSW